MAGPIPISDAAVLAAQAQGGEQAVAAYQQARAQLEAQRKAAVELAMKEAALRGTPFDPSLQSQVAQPYDQRIASLTSGQASTESMFSAAAQRARDYNDAVGSARSLIPVMTEQAVAPIRARNEFELAAISRQTEGRLAQIAAESRLTQVRAEAQARIAAARAAERAAEEARRRRAQQESLSKTELESELFGRARDRVQRAATAVRDLVSSNQRTVDSRLQGPARRMQATVNRMEQARRDLRVKAATVMAEPTHRRHFEPLPDTNRDERLARFAKQEADHRRHFEPLPNTNAPPRRLPTNINVSYGTGMGGSGGMTISVPQPEPPEWFDTLKPVTWWDSPASPRGPTRPPLSPRSVRANEQLAAAQAAYNRLQEQITASERQQERLQSQFERSEPSRRNRAMQPFSTVLGSGRSVLLSPQQISAFAPEDIDMVLNAPGSITSAADVDRYLIGAPGERGLSDPYSADVMRNAMIQAARELVGEGYEISEPELRNALGDATVYRPGISLYEAMARSTGQPTGPEEYRTAVSEQQAADAAERRRLAEEEGYYDDLDDEQRRQDDEAEQAVDEQIRAEFFRRWGIPLTNTLGPRDEVVQITSSPDFEDAVAVFEEVAGDELPGTSSDINYVLDEAGIRDPIVRRLIREIYGSG